jgi:hypothetical protein
VEAPASYGKHAPGAGLNFIKKPKPNPTLTLSYPIHGLETRGAPKAPGLVGVCVWMDTGCYRLPAEHPPQKDISPPQWPTQFLILLPTHPPTTSPHPSNPGPHDIPTSSTHLSAHLQPSFGGTLRLLQSAPLRLTHLLLLGPALLCLPCLPCLP